MNQLATLDFNSLQETLSKITERGATLRLSEDEPMA